MTWISVKDRLPEAITLVLAYAPNGLNQKAEIVMEVCFMDFEWYYGFHNNRLDGVTHWMPLPDPPGDPK